MYVYYIPVILVHCLELKIWSLTITVSWEKKHSFDIVLELPTYYNR